jgi:hypothetical protein
MVVTPLHERTWLSYPDLAQYLRKSEASLRQDVYRGRFGDARTTIGRRVLFNRKIVDRLLSEGVA